MNKNQKVLVLGGRGLVGSAIIRELKKRGFDSILSPTSRELNLLEQSDVRKYFKENSPDIVILAAAKVGGIIANNTYRADFIFENLGIQQNVFEASFNEKIDKLLFLGSSCIYPKNCPQPMKEEHLLTDSLEQTNEPYAIAKIAGLKMAESFNRQYGTKYYSVMPTNLYGVNDNYDLENSHVIPGLIARMDLAIKNGDEEFKVWGTGKPRREFLYVDDMASACLHVLSIDGEVPDLINIGTGEDIEIGEVAKLIALKMGYKGRLVFDTEKPDGTMRKLLDVSRIKSLGWKPEVSLSDGIDKSISYYQGLS
ncbi:GDP-fucose synthetase [Halobacteriovorax marinus]|uniref:GDP-L-fucose synthase family protein n=1 Tax=Halobacteriovorax marinus TaxID=97084 RepID=UPI000BC35D87|nr:GDP-L-fucose synthase [Halobacteriovorax marinus]ATH06697.1 GDP-fucose synthetase [Halobacteriovorax marinus]